MTDGILEQLAADIADIQWRTKDTRQRLIDALETQTPVEPPPINPPDPDTGDGFGNGDFGDDPFGNGNPQPDPDPQPPEPNYPIHQWWSQWYGPYAPTHPQLEPMHMIFARWPGVNRGIPNVNDSRLWPESEKDRTAAQVPRDAEFCTIDIEHVYPLAAYQGATPESRYVLIDALEGMKARRPDVKWAIYGLPLREYYGTLDPTSPGAAQWHARNELSKDVMAASDFLAPSIYRFFAQDNFRAYASAMIGEARKYADGKPVLPFIWPVFHPSGTPARALMTGPQWTTVLNEVVPYSDGVILWGDSIGPLAGGDWWTRTVAAMESA